MNLLASKTGRLTAFFLLYLTEGLPQGFALVAMVTWMRRDGIGVAEIGAFSGALVLPWTLKLLFGPMVDLLRSKRFGHRRAWILGSQLLMAAGLLVAGTIDMSQSFQLFMGVMVLVNACAALQDVAIDGLAVATLPEDEQGVGNGLMFAGAYVGLTAGGAGMLKFGAAMGDPSWTFPAVAFMVALVTLFVVVPMREEPSEAAPPGQLTEAIREYVVTATRSMFSNRSTLAALVLALLPIGALSLGMVIGSSLGVEFGLTDDEIGNLSLIGGIVAALGSVSGGLISDRLGHRRSLAAYVIFSVIPPLLLAYTMSVHGWIFPVEPGAQTAPEDLLNVFWYGSIFYGFFMGLMYGTRAAIFMQVCNPQVGATQFTAYMSGQNIVNMYSNPLQGHLAESQGYPHTILFDVCFGLVCLAALPFVIPVDYGDADHPADVPA